MDKQQRLEKFHKENPGHPSAPFELRKRLHRVTKTEVVARMVAARREEHNAKRAKKVETIIALRKEGKNYTQIAKVLGLSRERVRQLTAIYVPKELHNPLKKPRVPTNCAQCGKQIMRREAQLKYRNYCDLNCSWLAKKARRKYATKEEAVAAARARQKFRYQNDPKYREMHQKSIKKYLAWKRHDPQWKRSTYEYHKGWLARKMENNPEFAKAMREKNRLKSKERYYANREKYLAYYREYNKRNKEKLHEYRRKHYQKNKEKASERAREYYQKNKELYAIKARARYLLKNPNAKRRKRVIPTSESH